MIRHDFHGLPLDAITPDQLIDAVLSPPADRCAVIGYLNAHTVNLAWTADAPLRRHYGQCDLVYADGMAVVKAARRLGMDVPCRVSAADFFLRFCWAAAARKVPFALVGGEAGLAQRCAAALSAAVPGLSIPLAEHGYLRDDELAALAERIKAAGVRVVLLGMGSPRQEEVALALRRLGWQGSAWCVGALMEYYTPGHRPHAPLWMRQAGLEWLFRLALEPRRMARRYLIGNPLFLWRTRRGSGR